MSIALSRASSWLRIPAILEPSWVLAVSTCGLPLTHTATAVFDKVYTEQTAVTAAYTMNNKVVTFFDGQNIKGLHVLMENGLCTAAA